jgi:hypothetical protein
MLDVVWASLLPVGTISALYYADRIAQLPLGVVGIAIGKALLPLLARQLRAGQAQSAMANQNRAIEFGLMLSLPAALALWLLADPLIRTLFERGRFDPDDTLRTASALAAFAVGLPAFVLVKALTPGFFAREDTRTPLYIATTAILVNIVLNIVFLYGTTLAQVGIALASSLSGWLNAGMLAVVLRRRGQWVPDERLVSRSIRMLGATVGMGLDRRQGGTAGRRPRYHAFWRPSYCQLIVTRVEGPTRALSCRPLKTHEYWLAPRNAYSGRRMYRRGQPADPHIRCRPLADVWPKKLRAEEPPAQT